MKEGNSRIFEGTMGLAVWAEADAGGCGTLGTYKRPSCGQCVSGGLDIGLGV